ncbi:hypothetical protein M413DRAFT_30705 [Hebeloma cylindrosporum]|uniref:DUF8191 domain-containing protein n=1 Tax=Hebeloma cylindrosporum TaxID=76867 RepID=A0A0C2XIZ4_HEBCY|nr:hypothetical protein M413DRAFT_30705 [Hebeloma cylindrosporum h7]
MSLSELRTQIRIQKLKLKQKNTEISRLQAALRLFIANNGSQELVDVDKEEDGLAHLGSDDEAMDEEDAEKCDEEEDQEDEDEPLKPLFDESAGLYFCTDCLAEIDEGICIICGDKYEWQEANPLRNTESTENQAIHYDRSLVPRGNTPLLPDNLFDRYPPPADYRSREGEYKELLRRGATRIMCETFHLEFSHPGGIYAWADPQMYEEFSGPAMKEGDFWKIHLGRRVTLDQDDEDGSAFIDGLLEDALFFPFRGPTSGRTFEKWETVEETPGIWVTRLKANRDVTEESMGENDFDSDEEDHSEDMQDALQAEDNALENPPEEDTGPIRADDYAPTDSEDEEYEEDEEDEEDTVDEEDEEEEEEDMGAYITAQDPDGVWSPMDDEDDDDDETSDDSGMEEASSSSDIS